MATFQKVMTPKEWRGVLEFNAKVKAETGTPIIDFSALNIVRKAYLESLESYEASTKPIMATPVVKAIEE